MFKQRQMHGNWSGTDILFNMNGWRPHLVKETLCHRKVYSTEGAGVLQFFSNMAIATKMRLIVNDY